MALRAFHSNPGIGGFGGINISTSSYNDDGDVDGPRHSNRRVGKEKSKKHTSSSRTNNDNDNDGGGSGIGSHDDGRRDFVIGISKNESSKVKSRGKDLLVGSNMDYGNQNRRKNSNCRNASSSSSSSSSTPVNDGKTRGTGSFEASYNDPKHCDGNDSDAMCQIVKELVDNAIDACRHHAACEARDSSIKTRREHKDAQRPSKRIRVEIRPYHQHHNQDGTNNDENKSCPSDDDQQWHEKHRQDLMEIQVTDNGCGMKNIQGCVNAFQSTKGRDGDEDNADGTKMEKTTSGRYGVGLTLALLHSQRLVHQPLCNTVVSTTANETTRTKAHFKVDTKRDTVICTKKEQIEKQDPAESGTSVRVFVPAGRSTKTAWPRLKEYFRRFYLCPENDFGIDILAPSLSKHPIFIRSCKINRPDSGVGTPAGTNAGEVGQDWDDMMDKNEPDDDCSIAVGRSNPTAFQMNTKEAERLALFEAAKTFLNYPGLKLKNVARSIQFIRTGRNSTADGSAAKCAAQLLVDFIACVDPDDLGSESTDDCSIIKMIRMVNGVPMLDSAEAHACGLVHGLAKCKAVWSSFGLQVSKSSHSPSNEPPSFELRDSTQVMPFIRWDNHRHRQLDQDDGEEDNEDDQTRERKRGRSPGATNLLPARVRFGQVLVVVRIVATSSALPLPTLSKGRLPMNDRSIDTALQLGVEGCLKQLQELNPDILLSPSQLRSIERDSRYVPGISSAISRMICQSTNSSFRSMGIDLIQIKKAKPIKMHSKFQIVSACDYGSDQTDESTTTYNEDDLCQIFEERLRLTIQLQEDIPKSTISKKRRTQEATEQAYDDMIDAREDDHLLDDSVNEEIQSDTSRNDHRSDQSTASSVLPMRSHQEYRSMASSSKSSSSIASTISSLDDRIDSSKSLAAAFQGEENKISMMKQTSTQASFDAGIKQVVIPIESIEQGASVPSNEEDDFDDEWL